jgi:hypothetical protein
MVFDEVIFEEVCVSQWIESSKKTNAYVTTNKQPNQNLSSTETLLDDKQIEKNYSKHATTN